MGAAEVVSPAVYDGGLIINESGAAVDFRVEGENDENLLFVDGSEDAIGLGTNAPDSFLKLKAGTTAAEKAALKFTAGSKLTVPEAGAIEYDGKVYYSTHVDGARGVSPSVLFSIVPAGDFALQVSTLVQNCFPATGDTFTLEADTSYFFDGMYFLDMTTNVNITTLMAFALGGGASLTSIMYKARYAYVTAVNVKNYEIRGVVSTTVAEVVVSEAKMVDYTISFNGVLRVNAGGTVTPQIRFSTAPGTSGIMKANSFIRFYPIGSKTVQFSGNVA